MNQDGPLILLVEDEPQLRRYLRVTLTPHGYRLLEAVNAREGELMAASHHPDLILMDLGLPDMDGLELTRRLREWCAVPIIVVSARGQEQDKIQALDQGADDYLTKPFGSGELLARIRVALRHVSHDSAGVATPVFQLGDWRIDQTRREVTVAGQPVHLTPNEYKLLTTLVKHAGLVLTHHQLLKEVWGSVQGAQPHYLRVYMAQLRQKLEADPARPKHLITEPGVGYRLRTE
ncbi:MAG: response regulator [Holophaga sp.]|nr:response regulator [Holophaga sp.]